MNYLKMLCCMENQNNGDVQRKIERNRSSDCEKIRNIPQLNGFRYSKKQKKVKEESFKFYTNLINIQKKKQIMLYHKQSKHFLLANIQCHNFPLIENTKYKKRKNDGMKNANINVMEYSNDDGNIDSYSSDSGDCGDDMELQSCQHQICRKINTLSNNCQLFSVKAHKTDFKYGYQNTPEIIGVHVAQFMKKHNFQNIVDCYCGDGNNSIQMAQLGLNVVAIDSNFNRIALSKYNKKIYGVGDNMKIKCTDFLNSNVQELLIMKNSWIHDIVTQKKEQFDCVLVNPYYSKKGKNTNKQEDFTLCNFNHDIVQIIKKCLQISDNLVVLFPSYINIDDLDLIFNRCLDDQEREYNYMIDIQILSINNFMVKVMVFFQKSKFQNNNLSSNYIIQKLNEDNPYEQLSLDSLLFIKNVVQDCGFYQILKIIKTIENQKNKKDLNLQKFLSILIKSKIQTEQQLCKYFTLKNQKLDLNHYKDQKQKSEFSFQDQNQLIQSDQHDDEQSATFHPVSYSNLNIVQNGNMVLLKQQNTDIKSSYNIQENQQKSQSSIREFNANNIRYSFGDK